jgi:hypothetical protein
LTITAAVQLRGWAVTIHRAGVSSPAYPEEGRSGAVSSLVRVRKERHERHRHDEQQPDSNDEGYQYSFHRGPPRPNNGFAPLISLIGYETNSTGK